MSSNLIAPLPTVRVGGKTYAVKYAHAAFYLLSSWGIDISRIFDDLSAAFGSPATEHVPATETTPEIPARAEVIPNGRRTEMLAKIAAASLGTVDAEGIWRSAQLTPLEMMERLRDDEIVDLDRITWGEFAKKIGLPTKTETTVAAGAPGPVPVPINSGSANGLSEPVEPVSD